MTSLLLLPAETCASICDHMARADLGTMCRISARFQGQAQRILYQTVELEGSTRALKSWCVAVTQHSHLAERVHSITLRLPDRLDPSDPTIISHALSRCVNLEYLAILHEVGSSPHNSVCGWMMDQCKFKLTTFTNSYFKVDSIPKAFWDAQSQIKVLSMPDCDAPFPCSDTQLPNLIAVQLPLRALPTEERPLQRIQTLFQPALGFLAQWSSSLTTVNLLRYSFQRQVFMSDVVSRAAAAVPELLHFSINEPDSMPMAVELSPVLAFRKFTRLETLILQTRSVVGFYGEDMGIAYEMGTPAALEKFGCAIIEVCPTLREVYIGSEVVKGMEVTCLLRRDVSGGIHGSAFDFDRISKFR
ncbi:hypothetical protein C8J57DRAFT_159705 [Mycena rebaudengoi]|nr:hypothetical protein C8J57DRAFT_159705 [Mycena rebaudengoi]